MDAIDESVDGAVKAAIEFAEESPEPDPASVGENILCVETVEETQVSGEDGDENPLALAVQQTLREEMARDPNVVILGEDVTFGIFGVTAGLVQEFGEEIEEQTGK